MKEPSFGELFGQLVLIHRKEVGFSQERLAQEVYASESISMKSEVSKLENGKVKSPRPSTINNYCRALGITKSEIKNIEMRIDANNVASFREILEVAGAPKTLANASSEEQIVDCPIDTIEFIVNRANAKNLNINLTRHFRRYVMNLVEEKTRLKRALESSELHGSFRASITAAKKKCDELDFDKADAMLATLQDQAADQLFTSTRLRIRNLLLNGKKDAAINNLERLASSLDHQNPDQAQKLADVVGEMFQLFQEYGEGLHQFRQAVEWCIEGEFANQDRVLLATCLNVVGSCRFLTARRTEDFSESISMYKEGIEIARQTDDATRLAPLLANLGQAQAVLGKKIAEQDGLIGDLMGLSPEADKLHKFAKESFEAAFQLFGSTASECLLARARLTWQMLDSRRPNTLSAFNESDFLGDKRELIQPQLYHDLETLRQSGTKKEYITGLLKAAIVELTPQSMFHFLQEDQFESAQSLIDRAIKIKPAALSRDETVGFGRQFGEVIENLMQFSAAERRRKLSTT